MKRLAKLTLLAAAISSTANAGEFYLDIPFKSYHFNRDKDYNESNLGIGLKYQIDDIIAVSAGTYKNSHYVQTNYKFVHLNMWHGYEWKAGFLGGHVTGYEQTNSGGGFFYNKDLTNKIGLTTLLAPGDGGGLAFMLNIKL